MPKDRDAMFDASQPALIVTYGNTTKTHRPLDRELLVLGRAPGCDLGLVSPEVAPIHCLIVRISDGWHVRDCTGRSGTKVNGRPVHDEPLHDGDDLQVGTFSFRLHLPPDSGRRPGSRPRALPGGPVADTAEGAAADLARREAALVEQAETFRKRQEEHEARARGLEQAEQKLEKERLRLDAEVARHREQRGTATPTAPPVASQDLAARKEELEKFARHLQRKSAQLREQEAESRQRPGRDSERLAAERAELTEEAARLKQEHDAAEASLRDQRAEVTRLLQELRDGKQEQRNRAAAEARKLRERLAEVQRGREEEVAQVRGEVEAQRDRADRLERELAAVRAESESVSLDGPKAAAEQASGSLVRASSGVQSALEELRRQLADRDSRIERLTAELEEGSGKVLEVSGGFERELNNYRRELERDRELLSGQLSELQQRQQELESAAREAELQMSLERASIARDRAELQRLRDEVRLERERSEKYGSVREKLAPLQKLKEELAERRQAGTSDSAPGNAPRPRRTGRGSRTDAPRL